MRVASRDNVEVPPHPGRIGSHPHIRNISMFLQLQQPGDDNGDPPGRYRPARCGNPNPTGWLLIDWDSWSQRAARVAPLANVEVPPHPGRIGHHLRIRNPSFSITPTTWGRKRGSPESIPPRKVLKPQPHSLIAYWLGLMEPASGEDCPSGQGRGRAAHGEVKVPSRDQKYFHISTIPTSRGPRRCDPTIRYRPTWCGNPIRVHDC